MSDDVTEHTTATDDPAYTGEVEPGGASDVRQLHTLTVRKASVGPMDNNAYLLTCRATGAQLLIDAAADPERLTTLSREGSANGRLDAIVTTHAHHDHVGALAAVAGATGAVTIAGADDVADIEQQTGTTIARPVRHGDVIDVGELRLQVIGLRGHTPGSIALLVRDGEADEAGEHVFTGDSLFPGGVGATKGDRARFEQLVDDVEHRLFDRLNDECWVYPGHGSDTTIGAERPQLPAWRARGW